MTSEHELRRDEAAIWGARPERPRMRLLEFRPIRKGQLLGSATVELPNGLRVIDCPVISGKNGVFAALPSKPVVEREGRQKRDASGKPQYVPVLQWRTRDLGSRFSDALVSLVLEASPEVGEP